MKRCKSYSFILYKKYYDRKLELVMSIHVDDVFVAGKPDIL